MVLLKTSLSDSVPTSQAKHFQSVLSEQKPALSIRHISDSKDLV